MHDDGANADVLHQGDILHDLLLEVLIDHRIAAVLDDDGLSVKFLDVGQRLDEDGCLILGCECHTILPLSLAPVYQV